MRQTRPRGGPRSARVEQPACDTWREAGKLLERVPPRVLGVSRPLFLGVIGGLASLARDVVGGRDPGLDAELRRVEEVCLAATILEVAEDRARTARIPAINAPGGTDVHPS